MKAWTAIFGESTSSVSATVVVRPEIVDALPFIMTLTEATAGGRLSRATKAAHMVITPRERTGACPNNDVFVELGLSRYSTQLRLRR